MFQEIKHKQNPFKQQKIIKKLLKIEAGTKTIEQFLIKTEKKLIGKL